MNKHLKNTILIDTGDKVEKNSSYMEVVRPAADLNRILAGQESITEEEDAVRSYLKDIGRTQLLTALDERRLGVYIEEGAFLERLQTDFKERKGYEAAHLDIALELFRTVERGLKLLKGASKADRIACESAQTIEPQLTELASRLSEGKNLSLDEARYTLIDYSVAMRIIPLSVLSGLKKTGINLGALPSEEKLSAAVCCTWNELETDLNKVRQEVKKAEDKLVVSNLRLVVSISRKFMGKGVPLLDIVQEGNTGLMRAVHKFDYRRGYKFSTYATWWIRQSVTRALADQGRTIRIPVHMVDSINHYLEARQRLLQSQHRKPTTQEIANELDVSIAKVEEIEKAFSQLPTSLEQPLGDEEEGELGDLIPTEANSPEELVTVKWTQEQVHKLLESLTPKERLILELRFGIKDGRPYTLDEVGAQFHLTRERIRQIEIQAIHKLRQPNLLHPFITEAS